MPSRCRPGTRVPPGRHLEASGFEVWIVSGGGIEFMRPFAERVYGIPPQRIVGSSVKTKYEPRDGRPAIVRLPSVDFIDDRAGKPVGIQKFIGRRPIAAFGNSDDVTARSEPRGALASRRRGARGRV